MNINESVTFTKKITIATFETRKNENDLKKKDTFVPQNTRVRNHCFP